MSKKEKAQVHSGYRSAVFSNDTSGCPTLGGNLKKKNSHGVWQTRYFYLNNDFLIYKKDNNSTEIKGVVDIGDIASYTSTNKGDLVLQMKGGEDFQLKCNDNKDVNKWINAIQARMDWVKHEKELMEAASTSLLNDSNNSNQSSTTSTSTQIKLGGWLMKKSPHKYGGMQERYVRLENNVLMYFKKENDPDSASLGTVHLETADWVRQYDDSPDGRVFEIQSQQRIFVFEAESRPKMLEWIKSIDNSIKNAKELLERQAKAREVAALPFRIRLYDEKGEDSLVAYVLEDLEEIYPVPTPQEGKDKVTIQDHLILAGQVWDYIEDLLPEVAKVTTGAHPRPARLDVLAICLVTINRFLNNRLSPLMTPDIMDTTTLSLGDLHVMVDWLCRYQGMLREIYCPPLTPDSPSPTSFTLFEYIPELCSIYVRGSIGLEGAANHLKEHAKKVWQNFIEKPAELLETHQDGTFYTHCPIDIWELFHHHLSLAASTGSPVMTYMIAETIVDTINSIIALVTTYVEKMNKPDIDAPFREVELELLCSLANDIALHFEQLQDVIEKFEIDEIKRKVDELFDIVSNNLVHCGQTCLQRLSALIMEDINNNLQEVFTPAWVGNPPPETPPTQPSSQISIVIATVSDYMTDLRTFLVPFWANRMVTCILEALVVRYFKSVMKIQDTTPPPTKTKERRLFVSSRDIKDMVDRIVVAGLRATPVTVALIQNDTNAIVKFFQPKTELVGKYCQVLDDLYDMLVLEPDELARLLISRINQCPPAAQAIIETANRCAALRDDLEKDDLDSVFMPLEPMLQVHSELGGDSEITSVSEENRTLCGLYCNLGLTQKKNTLSSKLLNMASLPLRGKSLMDIEPPPLPPQKGLQFLESEVGRVSNVEEVINVLKSDEEEYYQMIKEEEEEMKKRLEEEELALEAGKAALHLEGQMEKKSPAHNLWQERWFKLMTRVTEKEGGGGFNYIHTLLWYKKKGGSALKAIDAKSICGMQLLSSPRSLTYLADDFNVHLAHDPEGMKGVPIKEWDSEGQTDSTLNNPTALLTQSHGQYFSFMLQLEGNSGGVGGEKDIILRVGSVDVLIKWMNSLSEAAKLEYDFNSSIWRKGDRKKRINPKSILKYSSMPDDLHKKAIYNRSVSAITPSHTSFSNVATATSNQNIHTFASQDSFEEQLREDNENDGEWDGDENGNENTESSTGFGKLPGGKTSLYLEGQMEKKSPAHNLWQERWFKLMTRVTEKEEVIYSFSWYKKRGSQALKTITADQIASLSLMSSPRTVVYTSNDFTVHAPESGGLQGIPVREWSGDTSSRREFIFSLTLVSTNAGNEKDIVLRVESIEKLINWINTITEAASLEYNGIEGYWIKGERQKVLQVNPKSYIMRASTTPVDDHHEKDKYTLHRSVSALPTSSSNQTVNGSTTQSTLTLSSIDDNQSDGGNERQNSNDSYEFPPPSPVVTNSPKMLLQKSGLNSTNSSPSKNEVQKLNKQVENNNNNEDENDDNNNNNHNLSNVSNQNGNYNNNGNGKNGNEDNDNEDDRETTQFNPITISLHSVTFSNKNTEIDERPSDMYSLHSEDIPEHEEEEESNQKNQNGNEDYGDHDDGGDGSKPVGCTSCVVM